MVGLIGEGQEIHLGEEAGLRQWNDAIAAMQLPWTYIAQLELSATIAAASVDRNDKLDLNTSLRSHLAEDVQHWIKTLLEGRIEEASAICQQMRTQGFDVYVTRDLQSSFKYARERYVDHEDKRFGLLASSKAKNLRDYGIRNDYSFTKNFVEGPWHNDHPSSQNSCCQLKEVATEFACQGLELDFPVLAWGNAPQMESFQTVTRSAASLPGKNPDQLRLNS